MTLGRVAGQVLDRQDTRGRPGVLNQWPTDDLIGLKALRESQLPAKSSLSLSCHSRSPVTLAPDTPILLSLLKTLELAELEEEAIAMLHAMALESIVGLQMWRTVAE